MAMSPMLLRAMGAVSLTTAAAASGATPPGHASGATPPGHASGFPGDRGRMFDGLPFPNGPLPPRPPETPVAPSLSLELSLQAARAAVAACSGYHIGVSIIDAAAMPKLYYIPDGTAGNHAYTAFRKANAALTFNRPSGEVGTQTRSDARIRERVRTDGRGPANLCSG
jgi:Haem-degrading